jgi:hypothetical protein
MNSVDPVLGVLLNKSQHLPVLVSFLFVSFIKAVAFNIHKLKKPTIFIVGFNWSGWQDSNLRPPRPKRGAITGLRYTPKNWTPLSRQKHKTTFPVINYEFSPNSDCKYSGNSLFYKDIFLTLNSDI